MRRHAGGFMGAVGGIVWPQGKGVTLRLVTGTGIIFQRPCGPAHAPYGEKGVFAGEKKAAE
jgi:hypothetical protein